MRNSLTPSQQFTGDYGRVKEQLYALSKIRYNYLSASSKVRSMKQTSKQDLSKIQKVEGERYLHPSCNMPLLSKALMFLFIVMRWVSITIS